MAFRYKLTHHPAAAEDFQRAKAYFAEIDADLAGLFQTDFRAALRGIATGRLASHVYAAGHEIRWVKLNRFSHKVFFVPEGEDERFILAVISGRRHPTRIRFMLTRRQRSK
jgi:plasmid stabilization system protein ParE